MQEVALIVNDDFGDHDYDDDVDEIMMMITNNNMYPEVREAALIADERASSQP